MRISGGNPISEACMESDVTKLEEDIEYYKCLIGKLVKLVIPNQSDLERTAVLVECGEVLRGREQGTTKSG